MDFMHVSEELDEAEQTLKRFYLRNPERYDRSPCQEEEVRSLLTLVFPLGPMETDSEEEQLNTLIKEQTFIPPDMDISFVRHMRYMPAFWHRHTFFELLCVIKGSCRNIFHDTEINMREGDICIHAPGTVHAVSSFSDDAVLINILLRKSTFEQAFFSLMNGSSILAGFFRHSFYRTREMPYLLFHTGEDAIVPDLIMQAKEEAASGHRYKRHMVNILISQLFVRILEYHEQCIEIPDSHLYMKEAGLMEILNYISANYASVNLKQLSARFNYSERQLQRIIMDATGISFRENIQNQKMQRAAVLLSGSDLSVASICEQTGYPSQNNFRKIFQRHYGMTPSEYRNQFRKPEN